MAGHAPRYTAVLNPEKRKVGSSILPLTTTSEQRKRCCCSFWLCCLANTFANAGC
jgi:hypothetical protein